MCDFCLFLSLQFSYFGHDFELKFCANVRIELKFAVLVMISLHFLKHVLILSYTLSLFFGKYFMLST